MHIFKSIKIYKKEKNFFLELMIDKDIIIDNNYFNSIAVCLQINTKTKISLLFYLNNRSCRINLLHFLEFVGIILFSFCVILSKILHNIAILIVDVIGRFQKTIFFVYSSLLKDKKR